MSTPTVLTVSLSLDNTLQELKRLTKSKLNKKRLLSCLKKDLITIREVVGELQQVKVYKYSLTKAEPNIVKKDTYIFTYNRQPWLTPVPCYIQADNSVDKIIGPNGNLYLNLGIGYTKIRIATEEDYYSFPIGLV